MREPRVMPTSFNIVHRSIPESWEVLLQRAATPDQATVLYHDELSRLKRERAHGEVVLVRTNGEQQTMLREPLR
jgi:hypothetical protein